MEGEANTYWSSSAGSAITACRMASDTTLQLARLPSSDQPVIRGWSGGSGMGPQITLPDVFTYPKSPAFVQNCETSSASLEPKPATYSNSKLKTNTPEWLMNPLSAPRRTRAKPLPNSPAKSN